MPFLRDDAWTFIFAVCDSRPHRWRVEEVGLFRQLADRLFARLEHALAEQAVANDLRDTQLLRDLSVRLVSESDTPAFYDAIVVAAMSITGAQAGCLQLLDNETRELALLAYNGLRPLDGPSVRPSECPVTDVVRPGARDEPGSRRPFRRPGRRRPPRRDAPVRGRWYTVRAIHTTGDARRANRRHAVYALERVRAPRVRAGSSLPGSALTAGSRAHRTAAQ